MAAETLAMKGHTIIGIMAEVPYVMCGVCGAFAVRRVFGKLRNVCDTPTRKGLQNIARLRRGLPPWAATGRTESLGKKATIVGRWCMEKGWCALRGSRNSQDEDVEENQGQGSDNEGGSVGNAMIAPWQAAVLNVIAEANSDQGPVVLRYPTRARTALDAVARRVRARIAADRAGGGIVCQLTRATPRSEGGKSEEGTGHVLWEGHGNYQSGNAGCPECGEGPEKQERRPCEKAARTSEASDRGNTGGLAGSSNDAIVRGGRADLDHQEGPSQHNKRRRGMGSPVASNESSEACEAIAKSGRGKKRKGHEVDLTWQRIARQAVEGGPESGTNQSETTAPGERNGQVVDLIHDKGAKSKLGRSTSASLVSKKLARSNRSSIHPQRSQCFSEVCDGVDVGDPFGPHSAPPTGADSGGGTNLDNSLARSSALRDEAKQLEQAMREHSDRMEDKQLGMCVGVASGVRKRIRGKSTLAAPQASTQSEDLVTRIRCRSKLPPTALLRTKRSTSASSIGGGAGELHGGGTPHACKRRRNSAKAELVPATSAT